MDLFTYLMAKNGHNTSVHGDLFSYLLGKGQSQTRTISGVTIYIPDAKKTKIIELIMEKESTQETTNGNQLIDFSNPDSVSSNITYNFTNNILNCSGTNTTYANASWNILSLMQANPSKVLKFKYKSISNITGSGSIINLQYTKEGTTSYKDILLRNGTTSTYTIPSDIADYTFFSIRLTPNNSSTAQDSSVTIEEPLLYFDNNNTYEEYTGGLPSPSPSYPQGVKTVKGYRNLFDKDNVAYIDNCNIGSTGILGTSNDYAVIYIYLNAGTYTVSNLSINPMQWVLSDIATLPEKGDVANGRQVSSSALYSSYTLENNGYLLIRVPKLTITINEFIKKLQIEKGNVVHPYVPYGNNYILYKQVGKNLFNINGETSNGTLIKYNNGFTLIKTTNRTIRFKLPLILSAGTYTFNYDLIFSNLTENNKLGMVLQDNEFDNLQTIYPLSNKTFTANQSFSYINFFINNDQANDAKITFDNICLIKGSVETEYEAYQESNVPIPLNNNELVGIGNYKDELKVDKNGNVFINKKTGKVVLDGSENWEAQWLISYGQDVNGFRTTITNIEIETSLEKLPNLMSNYFLQASQNTASLNNGKICKRINQSQIIVTNNDTATLEGFKTWLSTQYNNGNPVIVCYPLATPELIDLQTKVNIKLFKGENTITNSEDCNMTIEYY